MARKCKDILMYTDVEPREKRGNDSLRVVVPWKTGYTEFVSFKPDGCVINGFSVQVFLHAAVRAMQQNSSFLRYQFVVYGDGNKTMRYNEMLQMLTQKKVDMVVADLTITKERLENVSFTVPYMATQLAMDTFKFNYGNDEALWDFTKPFSSYLWITLLMSLLVTGAALYFLEDKNPDLFAASTFLIWRSSWNTHPSGFSSDAPQENPHINPQSDGPVLIYDEAYLLQQHVGVPIYDEAYLLQQHVGVPIYDEASRIRRLKNAFWLVLLPNLIGAFVSIFGMEVNKI
ncbi:hypothetical protein KP509_23G024000 [Ceratopteris richardii]|uniref:Ionotropic glutamate receptor L-glutamate and glycine-binding domain-containing protein n=1 Tax=Ceratopteris richardii TaxID=49495 RepID=A0A8T2RYA6_CERRI|nr:hypothetical protein KP509_23G024000 [Ceratopteris richardii]